MAKVSELQNRYEKKGWKFQFMWSSATAHLKKCPIIATNGRLEVRGTSLSNVFSQI